MKVWMAAAVGVVLMGGVGVAVAQGGPGGPPPPGERMGGPMGGPEEHGGWRHGRMMRPMPPSKAAFFRLRKGDAVIDIKCADDEPTKACVDAAVQLMDKAAAGR